MIRRNVESGNPRAIGQLGSCYNNGNLGLVPSLKKAAQLYQRAADLGDVMAICNLGIFYRSGRGVKLDKKKAVKYFRMAADRGNASAQFNLGNSFHDGHGVAQDQAEAHRYNKMAADQGFTHAEFNLGNHYYRKGHLTEAARWYERAAAKGHEQAERNLAILRRPSSYGGVGGHYGGGGDW